MPQDSLTRPSPPSEHPPALESADRPYLVPWGKLECRRAAFLSILAIAVVVGLGVFVSPLCFLLGIPVAALGAFFVLFFRNPQRTIPAAPGLLVSPADGRVQDIEIVEEPEFVKEPCVRIGIFLSVFDVHVNRAPARGTLVWASHRPGAWHDARSKAAELENEANLLGFERDDAGGPRGLRILVKQISGAIARRIVCPLEPPARVARGGLLGMIKYGSRTELYVPRSSGVEVRVRLGSKVRGGSTVVAAWPEVPSRS